MDDTRLRASVRQGRKRLVTGNHDRCWAEDGGRAGGRGVVEGNQQPESGVGVEGGGGQCQSRSESNEREESDPVFHVLERLRFRFSRR